MATTGQTAARTTNHIEMPVEAADFASALAFDSVAALASEEVADFDMGHQ
jgi:hypothetical protein